jgi:hypothetical protein
MNLAQRLVALEAKGFTAERAETILLMQEAAFVLFKAFPNLFSLCGGASLIFFHNSVRHSADLDLLSRGEELPQAQQVVQLLSDGLEQVATVLNLSPLGIKTINSTPGLLGIEIADKGGRRLFTVDFTRIAPVLEAGIEERTLESLSLNSAATITSLSRNHLLLQKAETFLLRQLVKPRDAYDIKLLMDSGASLDEQLENYLNETLSREELEAAEIRKRISSVNEKRCQADLRRALPDEVYKPLEEAKFQPLRDALLRLFERWLET